MKTARKIAFDFVLEQLETLRPVARPMFGCHGIYVNEMIVLITRQKNADDHDDGVWIATKSEHHEALKKLLPSMRSIGVLGKGETNWQIIPKDSDTFEEEVMTVCDLILKRDPRIGSIPKAKKPKTTRKR